MSNKTKLILIISFILILMVLIFILIYSTLFTDDKTKEVIALKNEEIVKIDINNEEEYEEEQQEYEEEVITVILNEKKEEIILYTPPEPERNEFESEGNSEERNQIESDETLNQEMENEEVTNSNVQEENNSQQESTNNVTQSTTSFYIKVNYGANVVTVYTNDENGNYTIPYKAFVCSTGTATPTSGVYNMDYKYRWISLFGDVYGQYATRVVGNILFHSVPYLEKWNPASLEYWEYDKLGTSASMGCIRLTVEDAKWIYDNCQTGTAVEFYSSDDPGPLGKPEAIKITEYEEYRGWDPTDPDENNPWITILGV